MDERLYVQRVRECLKLGGNQTTPKFYALAQLHKELNDQPPIEASVYVLSTMNSTMTAWKRLKAIRLHLDRIESRRLEQGWRDSNPHA